MMEFTLKVNEEDIKILDAALVNLPFGQVVGLVNKLQSQIKEQLEKVDN